MSIEKGLENMDHSQARDRESAWIKCYTCNGKGEKDGKKCSECDGKGEVKRR